MNKKSTDKGPDPEKEQQRWMALEGLPARENPTLSHEDRGKRERERGRKSSLQADECGGTYLRGYTCGVVLLYVHRNLCAASVLD